VQRKENRSDYDDRANEEFRQVISDKIQFSFPLPIVSLSLNILFNANNLLTQKN